MEHNGLFQYSINNALELFVVFDEKGKIVYANQTAEESLEYTDKLCGQDITEVFPGGIKIEDGILRVTGEKSDNTYSMMAYRGNRTCFPIEMKLFTYNSENGLLNVCMGFDASGKNLLEKQVSQAGQEAEEAQKVKTEFVANVTHELRTPVNGILGNTQELLKNETDKDKLKLLQLVERGCNDMHALINNILDFSKLDAGKFVLEPRKLHFRNMIDYVKGNHSNRIVEKGLDFSVTVSPDIPEYIIGDELRIVQILNNLISNAYKFTSVGGIHVEVVKTGQVGNKAEIFFMVIDSGIGIAKADQDKLFKSFTQVDASISRRYGGTGLGLNISKQLVELMGGNIHVESDTGKGTTFTFSIWVEIPKDECSKCTPVINLDDNKFQNSMNSIVNDKIWQYGEPENKEEIEKKMSKLILSVEMENWEKAEMFAETIKQLVEEAPREVKSAALRMKMAVQKGDYEKASTAFEALQDMVSNCGGVYGGNEER